MAENNEPIQGTTELFGPKPKQFRIYRANKQNTGTATAWELSYKPQKKYDQYEMFLSAAKQTGTDENGNASFDWSEGKKITVKLGVNDVSEILAVINGVKDSAGYKGSLYHQTPGGGNKSITFEINAPKEGDYYPSMGYRLRIAAQDKDKNLTEVKQLISPAEAEVLKALLPRGIAALHNW
jgi:hypothetical protein